MENEDKGTRKRYSKEFKLEAVRMLEAGDKPGHQIEQELDETLAEIVRKSLKD